MLQYSGGASGGSSSSTAASGLVAYIRSLPPKPDNTLRLFSRKDYWTVAGDDALFVAMEYYKTKAVVRHLGGDASSPDAIPHVSLSRGMFQDTVRDLLMNRRLKVEVHARRSGKWALTDTASPGNLKCFEDLVFKAAGASAEAGEASTTAGASAIVAVKVTSGPAGSAILAAAAVDIAARRLRLAEMPENDQFTNFEALLIQTGASEVILPANLPPQTSKRLLGIAQAAGVLATTKSASSFSANSIEQDVRRLTGLDADKPLAELDARAAASALGALLKYLELLDDPSLYGKYKLSALNLAEYMRLDAAALAALHLFETGPGASSASTGGGSLFSLLNRCKTPQGSRKLHQWIKQPLLDIVKINRRLDLVALFVDAVAVRTSLHSELLKTVPDLFRLASKFLKSRASLEDMVRLYQVAAKLPAIVETLNSWTGPGAELLASAFAVPLAEVATDLKPFQQLVESTIDLARADAHDFVILRSVDAQLDKLATARDALIARIEAIHGDVNARLAAKAKAKSSAAFVKLEVNDQHGYYMRIARSKEKILRGDARYTTLETRKDGLSASYRTTVKAYAAQQAEIEAKVLGIGATYTAVFEDLNDIVASLDVLVALAEASLSAPIPYIRPTLVPHGTAGLSLIDSRHPCLEAMPDIQFIPNNVELGPPGDKRLLLMTGPNMGGKSTYIRQVGVIVLMAQIGCFVPASSATIPLVDCILARVGAGDSQLRGVSTFMAEMLETASILATASPASLIIIDELGRGTSTYDGYGLAYAIAEHIAKDLGSLCLFATHFHELTQLESLLPRAVTNVHVTAHTADDALTLLYKVRPGPCDRSFGIHVARLAHFPPRVINMAKRKAEALEDFDSMAAGLESGDLPAPKRAKNLSADIVAAGEAAIKDFLAAAKTQLAGTVQLDDALAAELSDADRSALSPLIAKLRNSSNPYVVSLLDSFAVQS
ncbi:DNA mismatch repair protein Msh2 [Thecamonas trahens ATCC 50062]|uniref:DNA mismatch repair protein Msh2 n=1 Tax=Thecamonas trahens ATCC 50062 TaxID=461836 RepID=A0A0L0DIZ2_THETB|nr:DNA mismatch repair protein Msh2 [Thecamonas trahens ATCC 50062]KNC52160.1 DNA mismatch repair protein Msh2 [Thecamonas trahens ATCC 50062]|eukprot:XP_013762163.1 DNA mismatch repair protein Msh2 [Thecamonas trahens ATCC 50062]